MSKNITLAYLECHDNQLTSLDVSKNTALTSLVCQSNKLSTATLNSLFGTLHGNVFDYAAKVIYVGNNPGTETCDRNIAKNKGWTVNDLRSY